MLLPRMSTTEIKEVRRVVSRKWKVASLKHMSTGRNQLRGRRPGGSGHGADIDPKQQSWDDVKMSKLSPVATGFAMIWTQSPMQTSQALLFISAGPIVTKGANNLKERRLPRPFSTTATTITSPLSSYSVLAMVLEPDKRPHRKSATFIDDECAGRTSLRLP